jgi:hypothetical protein
MSLGVQSLLLWPQLHIDINCVLHLNDKGLKQKQKESKIKTGNM